MMTEQRRTFTIVNQRGLHARASAKLVSVVAEMDAVRVTVAKDGVEAEGASILGLMMLGAAMGDEISVAVSGDNAVARMAELAALIESGFGEN